LNKTPQNLSKSRNVVQLLRFLGGLFVVLALTACGSKGSARLEGNWKGVRAEGVQPHQQAAADSYALGTTFEFKGENVTLKSPKSSSTIRFRVEKDEGSTVVIAGDKDPKDPQTFTFIDPKTFRWSTAPGQSIVFAKQ
jgi:hypothetical protein